MELVFLLSSQLFSAEAPSHLNSSGPHALGIKFESPVKYLKVAKGLPALYLILS